MAAPPRKRPTTDSKRTVRAAEAQRYSQLEWVSLSIAPHSEEQHYSQLALMSPSIEPGSEARRRNQEP